MSLEAVHSYFLVHVCLYHLVAELFFYAVEALFYRSLHSSDETQEFIVVGYLVVFNLRPDVEDLGLDLVLLHQQVQRVQESCSRGVELAPRLVLVVQTVSHHVLVALRNDCYKEVKHDHTQEHLVKSEQDPSPGDHKIGLFLLLFPKVIESWCLNVA